MIIDLSMSALMALLLSVCAYVQLNDPDWETWTTMYLGAATLTVVCKWLHLRLHDACSMHAGYSACLALQSALRLRTLPPAHWMQAEEGRELAGALIVLLWTWHLRSSQRWKSPQQQQRDASRPGLGLGAWFGGAAVAAAALGWGFYFSRIHNNPAVALPDHCQGMLPK